MRGKWNHHSILAFTDHEIVMLDFDNMPFKAVKYWAFRTMNWFKLEGFIILKSSENCYHVVFNRRVSWSENVSVIDWVGLMLWKKNKNIAKWCLMQGIKQASTLRVSPKYCNPEPKPSPRVVYRFGRQNRQIQGFLRFRRLIKNIMGMTS